MCFLGCSAAAAPPDMYMFPAAPLERVWRVALARQLFFASLQPGAK